MARTQTKDIGEQDGEKAKEKMRRLEPTLEHVKAPADESVPFPGLSGVSAMEPPIEGHAAFLGDSRFSHPANNTQKAGLVTELQQAYGNQYVQRLLQSMKVQAKLTVSSPDDQYENEADNVADFVTKASATSIRRQESEEEEEPIQTKLTNDIQVQRQAEEPEEEEEEEEPIQTKLTNDIQVQRQAEEPEEEEEEEPIQTKKKKAGGQTLAKAAAPRRRQMSAFREYKLYYNNPLQLGKILVRQYLADSHGIKAPSFTPVTERTLRSKVDLKRGAKDVTLMFSGLFGRKGLAEFKVYIHFVTSPANYGWLTHLLGANTGTVEVEMMWRGGTATPYHRSLTPKRRTGRHTRLRTGAIHTVTLSKVAKGALKVEYTWKTDPLRFTPK